MHLLLKTRIKKVMVIGTMFQFDCGAFSIYRLLLNLNFA